MSEGNYQGKFNEHPVLGADGNPITFGIVFNSKTEGVSFTLVRKEFIPASSNRPVSSVLYLRMLKVYVSKKTGQWQYAQYGTDIKLRNLDVGNQAVSGSPGLLDVVKSAVEWRDKNDATGSGAPIPPPPMAPPYPTPTTAPNQPYPAQQGWGQAQYQPQAAPPQAQFPGFNPPGTPQQMQPPAWTPPAPPAAAPQSSRWGQPPVENTGGRTWANPQASSTPGGWPSSSPSNNLEPGEDDPF